MSIGPTSIGGSAAGTFLAQVRGSDSERAQQDASAQQLRADGQEKTELASGVGQTDGEEHRTADRDADGRRVWQFSRPQGEEGDAGDDESRHSPTPDPTGQSGGTLDLCG
jgi:hypothetical protein